MTVDPKNALSRWESKKQARRNYETHWQSIAELIDPVRATFTTKRAAGENPMDHVFDSTPMLASRGLATAIDGLLKPKSSRWFTIVFTDDKEEKIKESMAYKEAVLKKMYEALYYPRAGFQYRSAQADRSLVNYGQGALFIGEDLRENRLAFRSYWLGNFWFDVDPEGNVIRTYTKTMMTAEEFRMEFGQEFNPPSVVDIEKSGAKKGQDKLEFLQVIEKRPDYIQGGLTERGKRFQSAWIDVKAEAAFSHGGFYEMPYVIPRWDTPEESELAYGPGTMALPDCQTLNEHMRVVLEQGQKAVDPVIYYPDDSLFEAARSYPGSMNAYDARSMDGLRGNPIFTLPTGDIAAGFELLNSLRDSVFNAFFKNILNLPVDTPEMTATEILERRSEKIMQLGPVSSRLEATYTAPLVERVYNIMRRRNALPPAPERLVNKEFDFQYRSSIQAAREMMDVSAYSKSLVDLGPLIQAKPELLDNIDGDQLFRGVWARNSAPSTWLAEDNDVAAIRQERQEAAEMQQALAAAEQAAGAAKDAGLSLQGQ